MTDLATRTAIVDLVRQGVRAVDAGRAHGISGYKARLIVDWARRRGDLPSRPERKDPARPSPAQLRADDMQLLSHAVDLTDALIVKFSAFALRRRARLHMCDSRIAGERIQRLLDRGWIEACQQTDTYATLYIVTAAGFSALGRQPGWPGALDAAE